MQHEKEKQRKDGKGWKGGCVAWDDQENLKARCAKINNKNIERMDKNEWIEELMIYRIKAEEEKRKSAMTSEPL